MEDSWAVLVGASVVLVEDESRVVVAEVADDEGFCGLFDDPEVVLGSKLEEGTVVLLEIMPVDSVGLLFGALMTMASPAWLADSMSSDTEVLLNKTVSNSSSVLSIAFVPFSSVVLTVEEMLLVNPDPSDDTARPVRGLVMLARLVKLVKDVLLATVLLNANCVRFADSVPLVDAVVLSSLGGGLSLLIYFLKCPL